VTEPDGIVEAHDLVSEAPDLELASPDESGAVPSPWRSLPSRRVAVPHRWRNPLGLVGAGIIGFTVLVAVLGPEIWRLDPNAPAYRALLPPTWSHPFGTDELGRDTLARIIHGAQVSLEVSIAAVGIAFVFGSGLGLACGYFRGTLDTLLMRVVDIMFAFPGLVLAIVVAGLLGPSRTNATIAIGITITPVFARVVRGAVLETTSLPYIEAAHALGVGHARMMRRHVLPNIIAPLIILATIYLGTAILTEAALSFLGLGTQLPEASWGNMLNEARGYVYQSVWMSIFPGAAIMIVVLGFNFLGDGLRDILDPRLMPHSDSTTPSS
jgi:peptide/nickel transport system permease protein